MNNKNPKSNEKKYLSSNGNSSCLSKSQAVNISRVSSNKDWAFCLDFFTVPSNIVIGKRVSLSK